MRWPPAGAGVALAAAVFTVLTAMCVKLLFAVGAGDGAGVRALHFIPVVIPVSVAALRIAILPGLHFGSLNDALTAVQTNVLGLFFFFERFPAREGFDGAAGQAHGGSNLGECLARLPQGEDLLLLGFSHAITTGR